VALVGVVILVPAVSTLNTAGGVAAALRLPLILPLVPVLPPLGNNRAVDKARREFLLGVVVRLALPGKVLLLLGGEGDAKTCCGCTDPVFDARGVVPPLVLLLYAAELAGLAEAALTLIAVIPLLMLPAVLTGVRADKLDKPRPRPVEGPEPMLMLLPIGVVGNGEPVFALNGVCK